MTSWFVGRDKKAIIRELVNNKYLHDYDTPCSAIQSDLRVSAKKLAVLREEKGELKAVLRSRATCLQRTLTDTFLGNLLCSTNSGYRETWPGNSCIQGAL